MKEGVDVWRKRVISLVGDYSQGGEGRVLFNAGVAHTWHVWAQLASL